MPATTRKFLVAASLAFSAAACAHARPSTPNAPGSRIQVVVDRRIELLSIIFRLAQAEEFSTRSYEPYAAAVDSFFKPHRAHPAIQTVRRLRRERGISHDAVISLAIHATDLPGLRERTPLEASRLERRWSPQEARAFLDQARDFARVSNAARFFEQQAPVYEAAVRRMRAIVESEVDGSWFGSFFGNTRPFQLIVAVAPGNGTWAYGLSFAAPRGPSEFYTVINVTESDEEGLPVFSAAVVPTIVHEFSHSFVNPVVDRYFAAIRPAADTVLEAVAEPMKSLGYTNSQAMISESLVRAAVAHYKQDRHGAAAARRELLRQANHGFLWIDELFAELSRHRGQHRDFEASFPLLASYYQALPSRMPAALRRYDAQRPRVQSTTPALDAHVDPAVTELVFRFDRPMGPGYATMLGPGGRDRYPETPSAGFDSTRTVFTMHVKLKPDWQYEFSLNAPNSYGFKSAEGVPLNPYLVRFTTGPVRKASPVP